MNSGGFTVRGQVVRTSPAKRPMWPLVALGGGLSGLLLGLAALWLRLPDGRIQTPDPPSVLAYWVSWVSTAGEVHVTSYTTGEDHVVDRGPLEAPRNAVLGHSEGVARIGVAVDGEDGEPAAIVKVLRLDPQWIPIP